MLVLALLYLKFFQKGLVGRHHLDKMTAWQAQKTTR
jgi:hypothetical protein